MSEPVVTVQDTYHGHEDAFYCKCAFCKRFWDNTFGSLRDFAKTAPLQRSIATSSLFRQKGIIKVGDRVVIDGEHKGVVKFVGLIEEDKLAPKTWVGVKLDEKMGSAGNGTFNGKVYFSCPSGHGVLVPYTIVRQLNPPDPRPPITGNEMFPSYETVRANRRIRLALEEELNTIKSSGKIPNIFKTGHRASVISDDASLIRPNTAAPSSKGTVSDSGAKFIFTSNKKSSAVLYRYRLKNEQRRLEQLKTEFGGGERGETLIRTLQKLQLAYEKGREYVSQGNTANG